ncbi:hypothetical protein [Calothrix sp. NIES-2098]|uniref:hypothetical protein n=1 Tax=Calothrix sp. NIES-2098 TaxID=1954171 RepID=UPI000B5F225F|nr:hypothetical protein NIES2098_01500 [Calothrix sp. NIES-2098]
MIKTTVKVLFNLPKDGPDRREALIWAKLYQDNVLNALQECPRGDWLIWMMTSLKVKPILLISMTFQCVELAIEEELYAWGDMPFRWGINKISQWLNGEATSEDCQDVFDELDCNDEIVEFAPFNPIHLANEIVSYLLNACIDVSEHCSRSDLASDLA